MKFKKVQGENKKHLVKIFTLSTCGWCKKTKELLNSLKVSYEYLDVDTLTTDELTKAREELKKYNPKCSFPTLIIDNGNHVIIGYKDDEIKEVLH
jgi:glutaredoxin